VFLEEGPQGKILRAGAGPVEKLLHGGLRDIAAGGKVGLMPHDLAPTGGIAKQLPTVAIGAAVEIVNENGHAFGLLLEYSSRPYHIGTMCGRYASFLPAEFIARLFATVNPLPNLMPTWNMAPTKDAPVVRLHPCGERHLDALKWGLVPYFTTDLKKARKPINARSETVATSGMFRAAFAKRRCLLPAAAYYEWRDDPDGKVPFAVARVDGDPVAFGGIWEEWRSPAGETLRTFATITTDANRQLSAIQDRMPVIIEPEDWPLWLGEVEGDPSSLLRPVAEDVLRVWPVDKKVGNVRSDGPELLEPRVPAKAPLL
jgi:putative SOS response-associated peptidase YedK